AAAAAAAATTGALDPVRPLVEAGPAAAPGAALPDAASAAVVAATAAAATVAASGVGTVAHPYKAARSAVGTTSRVGNTEDLEADICKPLTTLRLSGRHPLLPRPNFNSPSIRHAACALARR